MSGLAEFEFCRGDGVLYVGPRVDWAEGDGALYGTVLGLDGAAVVVKFEPGGRRSVLRGRLEPDLRPYGYAPGSYHSRCASCRGHADGVDKRASSCRGCALLCHDRKRQPIPVSARYLEALAASLERLAALSSATLAEWEAMPEGERQVRRAVGLVAEPAFAVLEQMLPEEARERRAEARRVAFDEWVGLAKAGAQKGEAGADA